MDIYTIIILISIIIGLAIFYYIIKAAIRNGIKEAHDQSEQHRHNELKKAIRDAINTALESREKQTMYEIKKAIYEGITAVNEDKRRAENE